jgi:hypothetical protein
MFVSRSNKLPTNNPCAQCGRPISFPIWAETDHNNRIHFVWHCVACDYRFQSMAIYEGEWERIAA